MFYSYGSSVTAGANIKFNLDGDPALIEFEPGYSWAQGDKLNGSLYQRIQDAHDNPIQFKLNYSTYNFARTLTWLKADKTTVINDIQRYQQDERQGPVYLTVEIGVWEMLLADVADDQADDYFADFSAQYSAILLELYEALPNGSTLHILGYGSKFIQMVRQLAIATPYCMAVDLASDGRIYRYAKNLVRYSEVFNRQLDAALTNIFAYYGEDKPTDPNTGKSVVFSDTLAYPFTRSQIDSDCFHPSPSGQRNIAYSAWKDSPLNPDNRD